MDDKGYAFTPLAFLLFIPIMIVALAMGNIVNELNTVSTIAIGGDVTFTAATNVYTAIRDGAADAGRNAAYNATRQVIDDRDYLPDSKTYVRDRVVESLNTHVLLACKSLENQTGRNIFINNISINNYTTQVFTAADVNITQEDPFGFYVNIRGGIPIKVTQTNQSYSGVTPPMKIYVSIEGLEDPYIWLNTKERTTSVIYKYQYYTTFGGVPNYHFADAGIDQYKLHYLYEAMNGTNNPSQIFPRPFYFLDTKGLSFFDRLENKLNTTSTSPPGTRMSTFVIGDPLNEDHGTDKISFLDHEYFLGIAGTNITTQHGSTITAIRQPDSSGAPNGPIVYLSSTYKTLLGLTGSPYGY
jgi:hypothetical protein